MNRTEKTITALILSAALTVAASCSQSSTPAVSTTAELTTTTAATSAPESTPAKTTAAETTASVTSETTAAGNDNQDSSGLFTLEDYGWVMNDVPDSLMDMNGVPSRSMAFVLHTDFTQLGDDSEIVF
ncbi:MAG: hypothetical protein J6X60_13250, partial [Ruminiclostridium sp.]|nr:hypothetical protein [Ruminiclostridium sp.]